jgi:hypothetical protein
VERTGSGRFRDFIIISHHPEGEKTISTYVYRKEKDSLVISRTEKENPISPYEKEILCVTPSN